VGINLLSRRFGRGEVLHHKILVKLALGKGTVEQ
jgi:hypothetical protein